MYQVRATSNADGAVSRSRGWDRLPTVRIYTAMSSVLVRRQAIVCASFTPGSIAGLERIIAFGLAALHLASAFWRLPGATFCLDLRYTNLHPTETFKCAWFPAKLFLYFSPLYHRSWRQPTEAYYIGVSIEAAFGRTFG